MIVGSVQGWGDRFGGERPASVGSGDGPGRSCPASHTFEQQQQQATSGAGRLGGASGAGQGRAGRPIDGRFQKKKRVAARMYRKVLYISCMYIVHDTEGCAVCKQSEFFSLRTLQGRNWADLREPNRPLLPQIFGAASSSSSSSAAAAEAAEAAGAAAAGAAGAGAAGY